MYSYNAAKSFLEDGNCSSEGIGKHLVPTFSSQVHHNCAEIHSLGLYRLAGHSYCGAFNALGFELSFGFIDFIQRVVRPHAHAINR